MPAETPAPARLAALLREAGARFYDGWREEELVALADWLIAHGVTVPDGGGEAGDGRGIIGALVDVQEAGRRISTPLPPAPPAVDAHRAPPPVVNERALRGFLSYAADVRAGRVKRLDRDVVLSYAAELERPKERYGSH